MVALKTHLVIPSLFCGDNKYQLLNDYIINFSRRYFIQDSTISMRLADSQALEIQSQANNSKTYQNTNKLVVCEQMIKNHGLETNKCDKSLWKSTSWQSIKAPPSPNAMSLHAAYVFEDTQKNVPIVPSLKPQNGKFRPPPLQPPQRNTEENEECIQGSQWHLDIHESKRGLIATDMKIDLGAVQRNKESCERTELQLKRNKFAYYDKECSQILDHVFLGSEAVAKNRTTLQEKGITHVLNCVGFACQEYFLEDLIYKTLWLQDSPSEDITSILYDVFDYFEEVREMGGRVFVHCCQGVSRSTSLVIAYLMWVGKRTFEDAFHDVKAIRGVTNPNMGFACQLLQCQKRIHALPISPKSNLRMYRMAPHSPYDPMHLVPKTINNLHCGALDSRGAFVILIPNTFFIWQGSQCDAYMVCSAHHFICQLIKYEKAKGTLLHIIEGEEPHDFWDVFKRKEFHAKSIFNWKNVTSENGFLNFGRDFHIVNKHNSLSKRISLYDKDFENYMKAKDDKLMAQKLEATSVITQRPKDSGWNHFQQRYVDVLEKEGLKYIYETPTLPSINKESVGGRPEGLKHHEVLNTSIVLEEDSLVAAVNFEEVQTLLKSPQSPNDSQCSSRNSSLSFHSFLTNSSHSPPIMASPCLSHPPSPTPSVSNSPSSKSLCMWSPTIFQMCASTLTSATQVSSLSNDNFNKVPPSHSSSKKENVLTPHNLSNVVEENASFAKPNLQLSKIFKENKMDPNFLALKTNYIEYDIDRHDTSNQLSSTCGQNERLTSSSKACCSFQRKDKAESSSSASHVEPNDEENFVLPSLFEWPQMEKIDMFDADDLDSDAAFVLLVPDNLNGTGGRLYLWVGSVLQIKSDNNSTLNDGGTEEQSIEHWRHIGIDLVHQLQVRNNIQVEVVLDGKEPNEFWDYFING